MEDTTMYGMKQLVVVVQPPEEFYKDEGGKQHGVECIVSYEEQKDGGHETSKEEFIPIPLRISLYYENEQRVEESDQGILTYIGDKAPVITWDHKQIPLKFRISKVSRRKDGQRFRVLIESAFEGEESSMNDFVVGVFTAPISVLSKRKLGEPIVTKKCGKKVNKKRKFSAGLESELGLDSEEFTTPYPSVDTTLHAKVDKLLAKNDKTFNMVTKLVSVIEAQNVRISKLEAALFQATTANARGLARSLRGANFSNDFMYDEPYATSENSSIVEAPTKDTPKGPNTKPEIKMPKSIVNFGGSPALEALTGGVPRPPSPFTDLLPSISAGVTDLPSVYRFQSWDLAQTFDPATAKFLSEDIGM